VVVGPRTALDRSSFLLRGTHWVAGEPPLDRALTVKIRHRHQGASARLSQGATGELRVDLETPQPAVTPGQAAVLYQDAQVLGGGWIV
jgi:tRNA-specific 2-thiouridylase